MKCPVCDGILRVCDTMKAGNRVKRIRRCDDCLTRFKTYESINIYECSPYIQKKIKERMEVGK